MSAISLKSITGITSITTPAGVDNQFTLHTNDTTQRLKVTESGVDVTGVVTARSNVEISDYIKHLGDTNTMIGFPSNDSFSVTTNNVTRMTFTGNFIDLPDAGTFRFGGSNDLQIYHGSGGASNIVHSNTSQPLNISATGTGNISLLTNSTERLRITPTGLNVTGITTIRNASGTKLYEGASNGSKLFHAGTERLSTELYGIDINGTLGADQVNCSGIVTASQGLNINVSPAITIRDGTTEKGYIGFNANDPFIGRKNGVGLAFQNNKIRPVDGDDGSPSNNTIDLGEPTYRFKDGYFAGNLVMASGHGIDFSATGDASGMDNELLDDYEEGSWTPQYQNGSGSITVNGSYSIQYGRYIKIGKMVYVEGALRANVSNNSNGTYDIGGLPFTVSNDTDSGGVLMCKEQSSWTVAPDHFSPMKNTTAARARAGLNDGASSYSNGNTSHFNSGSANNNRIYFSGSYMAA